jgi:hypothetical protein
MMVNELVCGQMTETNKLDFNRESFSTRNSAVLKALVRSSYI